MSKLKGRSLNRKIGKSINRLIVSCLVGAMAFTAQAEVTDMVIDVAEGQTATRSEEISGEVRLVKTGLGTLVLSAANTYTGGTALSNGVIEVQNKDALGTGEVEISGSISELHQLKFRVPQNEAWIANAITLEGSSSKAYPAFNFATNTYLSGAITANGDLYMVDTGYGANAAAATLPYIKFNGEVTVSNGFRIASAPHCRIAFEAKLRTPILEGYYVEGGTAANGGNAGSFRLSQASDGIDRIVLDQTSIYCRNANVCTNAVVEWTGEHMENGIGYFDMGGNAQKFGGFYTVGACTNATKGLQLMNSGANTVTASIYPRKSTGSTYWYFVIEKGISISFPKYNDYSGYLTPNFRNRRHMVSGSMTHQGKQFVIGLGASFPYVTSSDGNGSGWIQVYSNEPDVLDSLSSSSESSSRIYLRTANAVASVSKGHKFRHTSSKTSGTYGLNLSGFTLDMRSAKWYSWTRKVVEEVPCGIYTSADYVGVNEGTVRIWAPRTAWTNATWAATEENAELTDAANWTVADDGKLVFGVPLVKATINGGEGVSASATATDLVNFGKLTFGSAAGSFAVSGSGIVAFYDDGIVSEAAEPAVQRTFTFNVPVDFQTNKIALAAQDTLKLAGGLTNEVWRTTVESFTVPSDNAGTIELGGLIPTNLVINGGVLAIAEDAVLPDGDVIVLTIAEGAKISVPAGKTLRTKTTTYAGTQVEVGYFDATSGAAFMIGEGKVRVEESTTPTTTTETITWKGSGDTGTFSAATNWDPEEVNLGWANKYKTIFAKDGVETTGAVVDGAYSLVGMQFANTLGDFTLKAGDNAALTIGAGGITFEDGKDVTTERTITIEPAIEFLEAPVWKVPTNDTLVISSGVATNNFVIDAESEGTIVLGGTIPLTNTVYGTLAFADDATLPEDDTMVLDLGESATIKVNEGQVLKVKSVTTNGVAVAVGFFADGFVTGGGKVRVNESSAAMVPETITWKGAGDSGAFSAATNWDPEEVNLGWANKYKTIFAKDGVETTGAVVDGAYSLIGMQLATTLGNFTFKQSGDNSSLSIGAGGIAVDWGKDETINRRLVYEMPVAMSSAWSTRLPKNDTVVLTNGLSLAGALTMNGFGTLELYGDSEIVGASTINTGTVVIANGTLSGTDNLILKRYNPSSPDNYNSYSKLPHELRLNNVTLTKTLQLGTIGAEGYYRIRSSAPIGTTNYLTTVVDNGTMHVAFECGRVFVISNKYNISSKHAFNAYGSANDGPVKIFVPKISQSYRSGDGYFSIGNNVDLTIGLSGGLDPRRIEVSGANASLRFLDDDLCTTESAQTAAHSMLEFNSGNVYLNATHQQGSLLIGAATIHGEWGSALEIKLGSTIAGANYTGKLTDSVSFTMSGSLTNQLNGVSDTDGALTVNSGVLVLGANANLPNLRAVNVSGGELAIKAADPFGHTTTALNVTGGTIDLTSEEVTLWCDSATVNGAAVKIGTYTATNPGAFASYLTGSGKIRVGTPGTTFIIK